MKKRTRINNDLDNLYARFNDAIDSVTLPSEDELMRLLDKHDAQQPRQVPAVPVVPVVRRSHILRYVAAAAVVGLLAFFGWMIWPQTHSQQQPIIAIKQDSNNTVVEQNDSISPTIQPLPQHSIETKTASLKKDNTTPTQTVNVSDSSVENIIPTATPETPQTMVAASEPTDTAITTPQPNENDSIDTQQNQERGIEEYPVRPTIKETEDIIKDENNQRALRHRKASRRKNNNRREGNFIRKQSEKKDEIRTISPPTTPSPNPIPRPHTTSLGNGKTQTIWY